MEISERKYLDIVRVKAYPSKCVAEVLRAPYMDIRTQDEWWVWMSIPSDEDGPECIAEEKKPWEREDDDGLHETWYDYTRQMIGLHGMVDPDLDLVKWMLERGIAPNQPFLMRFYGFRVWMSDYDGDQDEEYESELVYVEPLSDKDAADAWYEWLVLGQDAVYREMVDKICNTRLTCRGCGNEIDPDCCGCGTSKDTHGDPMSEGHSFIPANCDCLHINSSGASK